MTIAKGEVFATYAEFESALKHYCQETNQEFVVARCKKNALKDDLSLRERPFKFKELKCAHHKRTKCSACIRINLKKAGKLKDKYMIVTMKTQHDNGCALKTNEGFRCKYEGKDESKIPGREELAQPNGLPSHAMQSRLYEPTMSNAEKSVDLNEIDRIIETMPEWVSFSSLGNDDVAPRENMNDANGLLTGQIHGMEFTQHNGLPSHAMQSRLYEPYDNLTFGPCSVSAPFSNVNDFLDQNNNASMHNDLSSIGQLFFRESNDDLIKLIENFH